MSLVLNSNIDALVAQINHVVEVNFLLRLARDLQNDDPRQQTCRPQTIEVLSKTLQDSVRR